MYSTIIIQMLASVALYQNHIMYNVHVCDVITKRVAICS